MIRKHQGFTLVEILVVISILAILAAILFPVLARAREEGRKSQCVSNLHQIGAAIAMYVSDYDDHVPYAVDPFTLVFEDTVPYTDLDRNVVNQMPPFIPTIYPYLKSKAVLKCTSEHPFEYQDTGYFNHFDRYGTSYEYAIYPAYLNWSIGDFQSPSEQFLMSDIAPWHGGTDGRSFRINELFCDFHVKNVPWSYYLDTVRPDGL